MKKKIIILVGMISAILLVYVVYFFTKDNNGFDNYLNSEGNSMEFIPMEENPNIKQDVDDFVVTEELDINSYASSIHNANILSIHEVLITDDAKYYVVAYADGYSVNVTYSNGEYTFEETPTELDLEKSD